MGERHGQGVHVVELGHSWHKIHDEVIVDQVPRIALEPGKVVRRKTICGYGSCWIDRAACVWTLQGESLSVGYGHVLALKIHTQNDFLIKKKKQGKRTASERLHFVRVGCSNGFLVAKRQAW